MNEGFWGSQTFASPDNMNAFLIQRGTEANIPSPGQTGRLYFATDVNIVYRDDVRTEFDTDNSQFAPGSPARPTSGSVRAWKVFFRLVQGVLTDGTTIVGTGEESNRLRVGTISGTQIADGSITEDHMAPGVTLGVSPDSVGTTHIRNDAVSSAKLRSTSGDEAVTTDTVRNNAITDAKLRSSNTDSERAVTENHIRNGAVTASKIPANTISSSHIVNGTIVWDDVATTLQNRLLRLPSDSTRPANLTVSTLAPTSGQGGDGDFWFVRDA